MVLPRDVLFFFSNFLFKKLIFLKESLANIASSPWHFIKKCILHSELQGATFYSAKTSGTSKPETYYLNFIARQQKCLQ